MKFKTNANLFGLDAGVEFEAPHTEFLQDHVDTGLVSIVGEHSVARDAGTGESVTEQYAAEHPDTTVVETVEDGPESGSGEPSGASAQPPATEPAESVSPPAKKAVSRGRTTRK